MPNHSEMTGIPVWGEPIENAVDQMKAVQRHGRENGEPNVHVALMADHHVGYSIPIGGVVGYEHHVSPSGVGYDIACGNKAVRLAANTQAVIDNIGEIMDLIQKEVSFGIGGTNSRQDTVLEAEWADLEDHEAWGLPFMGALFDLAKSQLGTVGSGNHYVDVFLGDDDYIWVGCHCGSRGLGHKITSHFLEQGGGKADINSTPTLFHAQSDIGLEYLVAMDLAGQYAYAGRNWICRHVSRIINDVCGGARVLREVHNHHDYVWREWHDGKQLWVTRKGATPNRPGQYGFIGGSMGDVSVITVGLEDPGPRPSSTTQWMTDAQVSLRSTVHGAGRQMSRGKAKRDLSMLDMNKWLNEFMDHNKLPLVIRGGGLDEAPQAYKRLPDVLAHHSTTTKILVTLKPIGICMA